MASRVDAVIDQYMRALASHESSGNPYIKNSQKGQSASGLYQFTKSSWKALGGAWGGDPSQAFGGLRPSVAEQNARMREFTARNASILQRAGITPTVGALSAAHFLGAGGAMKIWNANPNASSAAIAGSAAYNANKSVFNKHPTVASFKAWAENRATNVRGGGNSVNTSAQGYSAPPTQNALRQIQVNQVQPDSNMPLQTNMVQPTNSLNTQAQAAPQMVQPQSLLSRLGVVIPTGAEYLYKAYGG